VSKFVIDRTCFVEVGESSSPVVRTAREELVSGLREIFGDLRDPEKRVLLGTPETCSELDELPWRRKLDSLVEDGFIIDLSLEDGEETLVIAARHERALLYGVYRILEDMGASYLLDPPAFPDLDHYDIELPVIDGPDFSLRCASGVICGKDDIPWYSRNRFNLLLVRPQCFGEIVECAGRYGIELGVCGGDFTTVEEDDKKIPVNRETDHVLCASLEETWEYFGRIVERCIAGTGRPGVYSFRLTDYRPNPAFTRCPACSHIQPVDRILQALEIGRKIASKTNASIAFRTWGLDFMPEAYRHGSHQVNYGWDPETHLRMIIEGCPGDVILVTKETWGDFMITYPPNHWIGRCKPHAQMIEYQVEPSEYRGNDTIPCSMVERWSEIMRMAKKKGVEGTWACSWGTTISKRRDAPIGELLNSLNAHAYARLSWNSDAMIEEIYGEWAHTIFPGCPREMAEILQLSTKAVEKMMYVQGQRFNNHSGISGRLTHVEWCYHHYGFNDLGGRVTRGMLGATEENLERALLEKDDSVQIVKKMGAILETTKSRMPADTFRDLKRMLDGMLGLALLWREYARAFFLWGMLRSEWSEAKASSLGESCRLMEDIAGKLPDNSDLTGTMWRDSRSPSLASNIRRDVKSLVSDYEDFLQSGRGE